MTEVMNFKIEYNNVMSDCNKKCEILLQNLAKHDINKETYHIEYNTLMSNNELLVKEMIIKYFK
jgi:hypothetical protein